MTSVTKRERPSLKGGRTVQPLATEDVARLRDSPTFSAELRQGANRYISESPLYEKTAEALLGPEKELDEIAQQFRIATRREHIEAVAFAYAFWIRASTNPAYENFIVCAARAWRRLTRATTGLHVIVTRFVSYGDDDTSPTGPKRRLYNRDVHAILWLHSQGIPPDRVVELSDRRGEGLRSWDMKQRKPRSKKETGDEKREEFFVEHASQRDRHPAVVPVETSIELCLSFRIGLNKGQHRYIEMWNSSEARRLIEQFVHDIVVERDWIRSEQIRTLREVTQQT